MTAMRRSPPLAAGSSMATTRSAKRSRRAMSEQHREREAESRQILFGMIDAARAIRRKVVEVEDDVRGWTPREPDVEQVRHRERAARVEMFVAPDERQRADELAHSLHVESRDVPSRG